MLMVMAFADSNIANQVYEYDCCFIG